MRNPGRWAAERNIFENPPDAVECIYCDIPVEWGNYAPSPGGVWYHMNVPSAFWTLCPKDPEEALAGLHEAGQASTRATPWPQVSIEEIISGLQLIESDLR